MIDEETLELIGLKKNEAKVCLALLSNSRRINELEKITGLHRRTIYDCISRLERDGYVIPFLKNRKKYYQLVDVRKITSKVRSKIKEVEENVSKLLRARKEQKMAEIQLFTGKEAIKLMLEEELESDEATYNITSSEFEKQFWDYVDKNIQKRMFFGKPVYLIYSDKDRVTAERAKKYKKVYVRFVSDEYTSNVGFAISGDNVYIQTIQYIIKIKDKQIAKGIKNYFDLLWKQAKA